MGLIQKLFTKAFYSLTDYKLFMETFGEYLKGTAGDYSDWVFEAIDTWGLYFAKANFRLYDKQPNGNLKEETNHPIVDIFSRPNDFSTWWELKYKIATSFGLFGDHYFLKLRDNLNVPRQIWQLRANLVTPKSSKTKYIDYYEYDLGTEKVRIDPIDMIHLRYPDPENETRGGAIIKRIMDDVEVARFQAAYQKKFYKEGGFLGLTFSTTANLNKNNFDMLLTKLQEKYGNGLANSFKVALMDNGLQPVKAAYSLKDSDITGNTNITRDKVLGAFKVPKILIGLGESINRNTADASIYQFTSGVIDPVLNYIDEVFTQSFRLDFGDNWVIKHDPLAPKDVEAETKYYKERIQSGAITINEWRKADNENPYPYELANVPLVYGGGVMFRLDTGEAIAQPSQPQDQPKDTQKSFIETKDLKDTRYKQFDRRHEKNYKRCSKLFADYWSAQAKRVEDNLSKKSLTIDDLFNLDEENEILQNILEDEILKLLREGFKHAAINLNISPSLFDTGNEFVLNELRKALDASSSINNTTKDALIAIIEANVNESNSKIMELVKGEYEDIKRSRIKVVTNTTVTQGLNAGQIAAFKEAGVTKKSWLSQRDSKVRHRKGADHVHADGLIIGVDEMFNIDGNLLMYPGDPSGNINEIANCRCTILPEK